jgi:peptidoglycan DL-endopeptidase CwlO
MGILTRGILATMFLTGAIAWTWGEEKVATSENPPAASLTTDEIRDFDKYPEKTQVLLRSALELSAKKLGYLYGSADPAQGGMDCSGTIYYLLQQAGIADVPRSSSEQYVWTRKAGTFRAVVGTELDGFELNELSPGDLLFWAGTYDVKREPPVTRSVPATAAPIGEKNNGV